MPTGSAQKDNVTMVNARENLGPAEHIINTLLTYQDHLFHGRPGIVEVDGSPTGVKWTAATYKEENNERVVYKLEKRGKKDVRTKVGILMGNGAIMDGAKLVGTYRQPGIFPEVAAWFYKQIAEVYRLDNEFAAKWASYAFVQEHKDLKVLLAAFMLVQARKGDPVFDAGKVAFFDADYRDIGEAMMLLMRKDKKHFAPKMLMRIHDVLTLPEVVAINHQLGFGNSTRKAPLGRWPKVVEKWLRHREENPKLLDGLVKDGWRGTVMDLARHVGYKPTTPYFFKALRWKQAQAKDGRRSIAIGEAVTAAESWAGKNEHEVCLAISTQKPDWKRIVALLPPEVGVTRAVVTCAIQMKCLSSKDIVNMTPTLEELGLLDVPFVRAHWETAMKQADDMRAANIARNVRSQEIADKLEEAADKVLQKEVEKATRNMRVYFLVDRSSSMTGAIESAIECISKFLQGFPADRIHIATFNTVGTEIKLPHPSAAGVVNAFKGVRASGGTDHKEGVRVLSKYKPAADEDAVMIVVGDEEDVPFDSTVRGSGINPVAFGLLKLGDRGSCVRMTAANLGVPCFMIQPETFNDPYAIPRTIRMLMQAAPVGVRAQPMHTPRVTLIDLILKTDLLAKPAWA
jgi:hypothetical protein